MSIRKVIYDNFISNGYEGELAKITGTLNSTLYGNSCWYGIKFQFKRLKVDINLVGLFISLLAST